jgi:O-methyltransferase
MTTDSVPPGEVSAFAAIGGACSERIRELGEQVAALTHALAEKQREVDAVRAAYAERVGHLETHVSALTEAAISRENQLKADAKAYQAAYNKRVGELEAEVKMLTDSAIAYEKRSLDRDYQLVMIHQNLLAKFKDLEPDFVVPYERCRAFTMTSIERLYSLHRTVEYLGTAGIAGDLAECGVWRGGSCMLMALGLIRAQDTSRRIYMYDTFAGHPPPDAEKDVDLWGNRGIDDWRQQKEAGTLAEWGAASLGEVRDNLLSTGYPEDRLIFVEGMVETTLPASAPEKLALLRLDSDWYESTRAALHHLYPRLADGGVLIVDDYGHYRGQRKAVDEYFAEIGERPLLHRIDYSCRVMVKRSR